MDVSMVKEMIKPELLVLVPVLYVMGAGLKAAPQVANQSIPLILGGIGVLLSVLFVGATTALSGYQDICMAAFVAVTQGILCAGGSVYMDQLKKQSKGE